MALSRRSIYRLHSKDAPISKNNYIIPGVLAVAGAFAVAALLISRPEPTRIILEAQKKLVHEDFFRTETDFTLKGIVNRPEISFGDSRIELSGHTRTDVNRTDPTSAVTTSTFNLSLASDDEVVGVKGEARRIDHLHYLKLDEVSDAIFPGIKEVEGEWMRSTDPFLDLMIQQVEDDLVLSDLDAEAYEELHGVISTVPLFEYLDTLPSETIDDAKTYHYTVALKQEALAVITTLIREYRTGLPSEPEDYALELAKVRSWGTPTVEVWIGKDDWKLRKMKFASQLSKATGGARLEGQIFISHFGESFEVEVPEARDIEDIFGRVLLGRLSLAGERTIDQMETTAAVEETPLVSEPTVSPEEGSDAPGKTIDRDDDGLSDTDEFIFGTDPWNPDTDGDGWSDGVEVANGKNPLGPGVLFGFGL